MAISQEAVRRLRPVLLILLLAIGVIAIASATTRNPDGGSGGGAIVGNTASPVEELIPAENDEILRQGRVGVDLLPGWRADLSINGTPIPTDELRSIPGAGIYTFAAREGLALEELQADRNCATATVSRIANPDDTESVTWCFNAA